MIQMMTQMDGVGDNVGFNKFSKKNRLTKTEMKGGYNEESTDGYCDYPSNFYFHHTM